MEFDPDYGLVVARTDLVTRHSGRASLEYARHLLASGDKDKHALAWRVIRRALDSQVLAEGHPHRGAFRFFDEDEEVTGLNVVSFVLQLLHAIWFEHAELMPADLRALILERVRLALGELERMDVHPRYTNPALMDTANCIVWGQLLGDAAAVAAGMAKLDRWIAFTTAAGAPYEYNSPNYLAIDLNMLALLAGHAADPATRLKAQLMEQRVWLHALLHYHLPTERLAGPHSRAYHRYMLGATEGVPALVERIRLGNGRVDPRVPLHCPPHIASWLDGQAQVFPYTVREIAGPPPSGVGAPADLTTYCTSNFALGTASRTYTSGQTGFDIDHEANHCILYYRAVDEDLAHAPITTEHEARQGPGGPSGRAPRWRTLFTRFVTNDRYYGSIEQHALRSRRTNFYDQGIFAGHQHNHVAIALYGLELIDQGLFSVEAMVVMPGVDRPRALYAAGAPLSAPATAGDPPIPLPEGEWIVVAEASVWIGIRPLARDQMGARRDLELRVLPTGGLALVMPHYRGPEKWFWEYQSPHAAFYRRNIRSGCLLVVAEHHEFVDAAAFAAHLARAEVTDSLSSDGVRTVGYRNDDAWLELGYDLVHNETIERRIDGVPFRPPALASPWAVQAAGQPVRLGEAALDADGAPCVLFARDAATAPGFPSPAVWEALILADEPHRVQLDTPLGAVRCGAFGFGAIRVQGPHDGERPTVAVHTAAAHAAFEVPSGMNLIEEEA